MLNNEYIVVTDENASEKFYNEISEYAKEHKSDIEMHHADSSKDYDIPSTDTLEEWQLQSFLIAMREYCNGSKDEFVNEFPTFIKNNMLAKQDISDQLEGVANKIFANLNTYSVLQSNNASLSEVDLKQVKVLWGYIKEELKQTKKVRAYNLDSLRALTLVNPAARSCDELQQENKIQFDLDALFKRLKNVPNKTGNFYIQRSLQAVQSICATFFEELLAKEELPPLNSNIKSLQEEINKLIIKKLGGKNIRKCLNSYKSKHSELYLELLAPIEEKFKKGAEELQKAYTKIVKDKLETEKAKAENLALKVDLETQTIKLNGESFEIRFLTEAEYSSLQINAHLDGLCSEADRGENNGAEDPDSNRAVNALQERGVVVPGDANGVRDVKNSAAGEGGNSGAAPTDVANTSNYGIYYIGAAVIAALLAMVSVAMYKFSDLCVNL